MLAPDVRTALQQLFAELTSGPERPGAAFILNSGDAGLMRSLARLSPDDASMNASGGATIAAHAQHLRYGLALMNQWSREGGNPFADATWEDAWTISSVDASQWDEILRGLQREVEQWHAALGSPRALQPVELSGLISSVAHLAYHLGAIRQIAKAARGPREGAYHPQGSG